MNYIHPICCADMDGVSCVPPPFGGDIHRAGTRLDFPFGEISSEIVNLFKLAPHLQLNLWLSCFGTSPSGYSWSTALGSGSLAFFLNMSIFKQLNQSISGHLITVNDVFFQHLHNQFCRIIKFQN